MITYPHKLPQDIYEKSLKKINNICFSRREIDIISCLLSGRTAKSIGSLLSIAPRTVETHTRNIVLKLERSSREDIRNFIEKSGKLLMIREYYDSLLAQCAFEKCLHVVTEKNKGLFTCHIMYRQEQGQKNKPSLIAKMEEHLKITGITPFIEAREDFHNIFHNAEQRALDYRICIVDESFLMEFQSSALQKKPTTSSPTPKTSHHASLLFLSPSNKVPQEISDAGYIDCASQESYYTLFFEVLKRIFPLIELDPIIENFKREYQSAGSVSYNLPPSEPEKNKNTESWKSHFLLTSFLTFFKNPRWLLGGGGALFLVSILVLSLMGTSPRSDNKHTGAHFLGASLSTPTLLNRHKLIEEIDKKLKGSGDIQTVALIGMGGAGKTTLARQYAHSQKSSVIWEINAETKSSLASSFEALAYALCKTDEEKKVLISLKDISNFAEKEEKIIQLVKDQLKTHPNWFLIYDNVERFSDILKYFPSDSNLFGKGKIIITTQDTHIQNNSYVKDTLWIRELNSDDKLSLFMNIANRGGEESVDLAQQELALKFLENIPSFPLDIAIAAYYMKATNIDYDTYLKYLNDYNSQEFSAIQENVLKESSGYTKTRYHIITLSLEKLIAVNKDFGDLLLLISILDSKNIPRDLLDRYKGKLTVDNFIYYLKKYSLVVNPSSQSEAPRSHIFIHRSTQDIGFSYLANFLKLSKDSSLLKTIVYVLDDYLDQVIEAEDFSKIQVMAGHLEKFLSHLNLLTDFSKGLLGSKLGSIYYFINDDKSKQTLENSLNILEKKSLEHLSSEDHSRLARSLLHIGAVYTEQRLDKEAKEVLEKVVHIYGEEGSKNYLDLSRALSHLGDLQKRFGNYEAARNYLEESIRLQKRYGDDNKRIARTLAYLGSVYRGLGFYQKATDTLEESLAIYKKNYPNDHIRIGWILIHLGNVYRRLGNLQQAKDSLEKGFIIFQKHFPENHLSMGLVLAYLGGCYRELGDYEKSRDYLEHSLRIHQKNFDENHIKMGWILFHLAITYKAMGNNKAEKLFDKVLEIYASHCDGDNIETARTLRNMAKICMDKNRLEDADNYIQRSLKILQSRRHVEVYRSLKTLGEILLKNSAYSQDRTAKQDLRNQAIDKFNQALKIAEQHFPKNSLHIQKIQARIKSMRK